MMINFKDILKPIKDGFAINPYAYREVNSDEWMEGTISVDYLNENFRHFSNVDEMKESTESESLKLYFDWLKEQGILD